MRKWTNIILIVVLFAVFGGFQAPMAQAATNNCTAWAKTLRAGPDSFTMHTLGCDDHSPRATYKPAKGRCNELAYNKASSGLRGSRLVSAVKARSCVYFEDGTYGERKQ
jgi:hypothetical protein